MIEASSPPLPVLYVDHCFVVFEDHSWRNYALKSYFSRFAIMHSCWLYSAEDQPDFAYLSSQIDSELSALADYVDLSMFEGEGTAAATQE